MIRCELPPIYIIGVWLAILLAIGFIGVYAWQITEESRQLADALAATELVLAREQHLSQLDGLAAAAAHELGTPLSTIAVIAKELENAHPGRRAARRGRPAVARTGAGAAATSSAKLTELSASGEPFDRMPLTALMEEVVAPHRDFGVAIEVAVPPARQRAGRWRAIRRSSTASAICWRTPSISPTSASTVGAELERETVEVTIADDGPGFAPEIMARIGEPYVTNRRRNVEDVDDEPKGLGLGLLHRQDLAGASGATLTFENRPAPAARRRHQAALESRRIRAPIEPLLRLEVPRPRALRLSG